MAFRNNPRQTGVFDAGLANARSHDDEIFACQHSRSIKPPGSLGMNSIKAELPISPAVLYVRSVFDLKRKITTAFVSSLLAFGAQTTTAAEIKVGVVQDQSSLNADLARDYMAGARAYFDFHNSQNNQKGIAGMRFNLVVKDDEGNAAKTVAATRQLIEIDKVDALFGYVGDDTVAAVAGDELFRRTRIALYAPLSGDAVSALPDTIFYVRPTYREEARHIINHFNLFGNKDFLVISSATPAGDRLTTQITEEAIVKGLRVPANSRIATDARNVDQIVAQVVRANPQVVIMTTDTIATAEFIRRFRKLDKGTSVVGLSTINHRTLMELAKPEFAASMMLTQVVPHPDVARTQVQVDHLKYMAKYRDEPPSHVTLEGFIAAKSFANAITGANATTRPTILAALSGARRVDVGGINLVFTSKRDRGSALVELAFLRKSGQLIQ